MQESAISNVQVPNQTHGNGLRVLLQRENRVWWGSRRWLVQTLLAVGGLNGLLAVVLYILPNVMAAAGETMDPIEAGVQLYMGLGAFAIAIDTIILTQDTLIGEIESGVAEWVLSKPVSRASYILAKLLANALGLLVTLIILPGAVAYLLLSLANGAPYPALAFVGALGILALHTLFYLALSLLMGAVVKDRGLLLAVTLGSLLGGALFVDLIPQLTLFTPWALPNIAAALGLGVPLPPALLAPIAVTLLLSVAAVALALWRFERREL